MTDSLHPEDGRPDGVPGPERVGFIGLGSQGGPMARRIIEAGFPVTLWARRIQSLESYADTDATIVQTPAALGAASDVVCICVVDDVGIDAVVRGSDGVLAGMAPGGIIVIHSTVHPDSVRRVAEYAAQYGVGVIDAPVSGGGPAAAEQRLLVMAGGDQALVERCRPIFATYGDPVLYMGELGSGEVAKLINNTALTANLAVASGVLRIGESLGIEATTLAELISHGTGASAAISMLAPRSGDLEAMGGKAGPLLRKDVGILAELLESSEVSTGAMWAAADSALADMKTPRVG